MLPGSRHLRSGGDRQVDYWVVKPSWHTYHKDRSSRDRDRDTNQLPATNLHVYLVCVHWPPCRAAALRRQLLNKGANAHIQDKHVSLLVGVRHKPAPCNILMFCGFFIYDIYHFILMFNLFKLNIKMKWKIS